MEWITQAREHLNYLLLQMPAALVKLPSGLRDRLSVIPLVFEQQK